MRTIILIFSILLGSSTLFAQKKFGINTTNPGYGLDVFDADNQGFFANFASNNQNNSIIQIQGNYSPAANNTAYIGVGLYRNGGGKGYLVVDPSNSLVLSTAGNAAPHFSINPTGNIGIGINNAGFPLNFANVLGDKISLWNNTGNTYGLGVQDHLMQIHTDVSSADIAFGYGSSTALTERMRIKGNGNVGIGINPTAKLQIAQQGLYTRSEGQGNAVELVDNSTATNHFLYMGADATNQLSFIQSVATGGYRPLVLQGRGGNVGIGVISPGQKLEVAGNIKTTSDVLVQNDKGIIRNNSGTQLKMVVTTHNLFGTFPAETVVSNDFPFSENFPAGVIPVVYVSNFVSVSGECAKIMVSVSNVTNTSFRISGFNPTNSSVSFNGNWNFVAVGQAQ